jgi:hypothetical protein
MRTSALLAALSGLALRVFFVLKFPVKDSGDSSFYMELAWNWLKHGVYGGQVDGQLMPLDMRVPGYPAFLAAIFGVAGYSQRAVMFAQVAVDIATCCLVALIAARLAREGTRRRVAIAGLWLAACCPFLANYTAAVLAETLATFLTALAILVLLETDLGPGNSSRSTPPLANRWFLGGLVVGFGALVRPETPLLAIAAVLVLVLKNWRPTDWLRLVRAGVLMGVGLILPLVPWGARNWRSLHEVQLLAPRYLAEPGDYVPLGFMQWTKTWLWRFRDVYFAPWKVGTDEISIDDLPASAFDSADERARMAAILDQYNDSLTIDPRLDSEFLEIAKERTARHPLRTYAVIPMLRSLALWFTPRIELLPYSGNLRPVRDEWQDDRRDFVVTLGLASLNCLYIALAIAGAWVMRHRPGLAFLIVFIIVRTAFFTQNDTPEPRYMLECYPAVIALGAQVFCLRPQLSSTGSG